MSEQWSMQFEGSNLSLLWTKAFLRLMQPGVKELVPLMITVKNIERSESIENPEIRRILDNDLMEKNKPLCKTVSGTIFPTSMWNPDKPRHLLFDRYKKALPVIKKTQQNRNGLYFERLIQYGSRNLNQLDFFIESRTNKRNMRRSVLQASITEPERDLTHQRVRGFPCLQQVSFVPFDGNRKLAVNGFYGTQYIYDKGYGNYLGLLDLGEFIAHELGLSLSKVNCFAGNASLGNQTKKSLRKLENEIQKIV